MLEQRAAQGAFQGMDRPMHADVTGLQFGSGPRQVAGAHEGEEHLEFFQGQLFIDQHGVGSYWDNPIVHACGLDRAILCFIDFRGGVNDVSRGKIERLDASGRGRGGVCRRSVVDRGCQP
ncbi:hypothetical protein D3C79_932770 [compost metagenome]